MEINHVPINLLDVKYQPPKVVILGLSQRSLAALGMTNFVE